MATWGYDMLMMIWYFIVLTKFNWHHSCLHNNTQATCCFSQLCGSTDAVVLYHTHNNSMLSCQWKQSSLCIISSTYWLKFYHLYDQNDTIFCDIGPIILVHPQFVPTRAPKQNSCKHVNQVCDLTNLILMFEYLTIYPSNLLLAASVTE